MEFVLRTILDLACTGIAGMAKVFGNGIFDMLTVDIGSSEGGGGLFAMLFNGMEDFYDLFKIIAFVLLAMTMFLQLAKIILLPDGGGQTPGGLIAASLASGIGIAFAKPIVLSIASIFNKIYKAILSSSAGASEADFVNKFGYYADSIVNEGVFELAGVSKLAPYLLCLVMILLIVYQFFMYMIEVVERYILLGVLIYSSPLPFSMAASKTTRGVFSSWVRMVMSQFFLMLCSVIFFRLFISGMYRWTEVIGESSSELGVSSSTAAVIVTFMLYGILYIAQKVDTYLGTLGLSAAQTGTGLAMAMVAAGTGLFRGVSNMARIGRGVAGLAAKLTGGGGTEAKVVKNQKNQDLTRDKDGTISKKSFKDLANNNLTDEARKNMNGADLFNGVQKNMNMPNSILNDIDQGSAKVGKNGDIQMTSKDGACTYSLMPKEGNEGLFKNSPGREVAFTDENGKQTPYILTASSRNGTQDVASTRLAANESFADKIRKDESNNPNVHYNKVAPGIYDRVETDGKGNLKDVQRFSADCVSSRDAAYNSRTERIGDMDYHVANVTAAAQGNVRMDQQSELAMRGTPADAANILSSNFSAIPSPKGAGNADGIYDVKANVGNNGIYQNSGVHAFKVDGENGESYNYVMAPAAQYAVNDDFSNNCRTTQAKNGAEYVFAFVGEGNMSDTAINDAANAAFSQRSAAPDGTPSSWNSEGVQFTRGGFVPAFMKSEDPLVSLEQRAGENTVLGGAAYSAAQAKSVDAQPTYDSASKFEWFNNPGYRANAGQTYSAEPPPSSGGAPHSFAGAAAHSNTTQDSSDMENHTRSARRSGPNDKQK